MIVDLKNKHFLASGDNRQCFFHPYDENLCVKVLHPHREMKIQTRELSYYNALAKRKISWRRLAKMEAPIQTNLGLGLVFEVVRDFDGQISKTLHHYLSLEDPAMDRVITKEIKRLKKYLYTEAIVFRDLITLNILLQRTSDNEFKAVIIDGIGHNDFIPFCNYSVGYSRKKIVRTWNRKKAHWFDQYAAIKDKIHLMDAQRIKSYFLEKHH